MAIYALGHREPSIHPDAFVHPDAVIIGDVTIGAESTVWPGAVLRGDEGSIVVGARTSVQDGAVLHCTAEHPTLVGDDCTLGHLAHLEGCTVERWALVGVGAAVLHRAVVGEAALVGAGAVVTNDTVVPPGALAIGIPAKIREGAADVESLKWGAEVYRRRGHQYRAELRRLD